MNKHLFTTLVVLFSLLSGYSQQYHIPLDTEKAVIEIKENRFEKLSLRITHNEINGFLTETSEGLFLEISIPGIRFTGKAGDPKLPAYSEFIEMPQGAEIQVKVVSYDTKEYKLKDYGISVPVIPAQASLRKDQNPAKAKFYKNEAAYNSKSFTDYPIVELSPLGTMRSVDIAQLAVMPLNYNPAEGTIKVYNNIEIDIYFINADKQKDTKTKQAKYSPYFEAIYSNLLNYKSIIDDYPDLSKYPVKMLVLADRDFEEALQPYIEWKTKKGFEMIVNYTDEGYATVQEIKDWIQMHYQAATAKSPAPSFCLFVGDVAQIPASQTGVRTGKMTDLYYFSQDGDYFPEMYYGRFSANDLSQLQPQIDKTLYYERYEFSDPSYLDDVTLIAGSDATWNPRVGQPTVKYGTENYFNTSLGFVNVNDYLTSYSGCYDNARISVSFINYTAHCSQSGWGSPYFSVSNAHATTNEGKYPLAVGNCCLSADFGYHNETIGEAWVRAENGAVAYIGSSPNTYWFEDFYWAVGAFPLVGTNDGYVPTVEETTPGVYDAMFAGDYISVGGTIFLGNLAVTQVDIEGYPQHSSPLYYWEAYNCLGDPSLIIYKTQGLDNPVSHNSYISFGADFYEISAAPGSYAAMSKDGKLLGAAIVGENGTVHIPIEIITSGGTVDIVVTAPQYKPYISSIAVVSSDGAFLTVDDYVKTINYSQSVDLKIVLSNVGSETASEVEATMTLTDENANITNGYYFYDDLAAGGLSGSSGQTVFTLETADDAPNGYIIHPVLEISDIDNNSWTYTLTVSVNAPEIETGELFISNDDNNNGVFDVGETADINFTIKNSGAAGTLFTGEISITDDPNDYLSLGTSSATSVFLEAGETGTLVFDGAFAASDTPPGSPIGLAVEITAGDNAQYALESLQTLRIGELPEYTIKSEGIVYACNGLFYDSGGADNQYGNNEHYTITFFPSEEGRTLHFSFKEFQVEELYGGAGCWDKLFVYDGADSSAPLIGEFCGYAVPPELHELSASNSDGALTFIFESDATVTAGGWKAEISCTESLNISAQESGSFLIAPNPNNGLFDINFSQIQAQHALVKIYSLSGKLVHTEKLETLNKVSNYRIEMQNLTPGLYHIYVITENDTHTEKFVKL